MVYSHKLRALRDAKGMSNHELSELSGVPESTICRIMSGQTDNPSLSNVCDILKALGGSLDDVTGLGGQLQHPDTKAILEAINAFSEHCAKLEQGLDPLHKVLVIKDRWISRMFVYCCVITLLYIATVIVAAAILIE